MDKEELFETLSSLMTGATKSVEVDDIGLERGRYLDALLKLWAGDERAIAFLWLYDDAFEASLALAQVQHSPVLCECADDKALRRQFVAYKHHPQGAAETLVPEIGHRDQAGVDQYIDQFNWAHRTASDAIIHLWHEPELEVGTYLGCVYLFSFENIDEKSQLNLRAIAHVQTALANKIVHSRHHRILETLRQFQDRVESTDNLIELFRQAANLLQKYTACGACYIFLEKGSRGIEPVARNDGAPAINKPSLSVRQGSFSELVHRSRQSVRLRNAEDVLERQSVCPKAQWNPDQYDRVYGEICGNFSETTSSDMPGKSWLCVPILVESYQKDEKISIGLIKLYCKRPSNFLAGSISANDEELTKRLASYLGLLFSRTSVSEAINALAEALGNTEAKREDLFAEFGKMIDDYVPGVVNLGIWPAKRTRIEWLWADRNRLIEAKLKRDKLKVDEICRVSDIKSRQEIFVLRQQFPDENDSSSDIVVVLSRKELTNFHIMIMRHVAIELYRLQKMQKDHEDALHRIIEIRHNLRRDVMAAMGNMDAAISYYEDRKADSPEDVKYDLYTRRRFRELLNESKYFLSVTHTLTEESKFLLDGIKPENLRRSSHDIIEILNRAISSVQAQFDRRKIELRIMNNLKDTDRRANCDFDLIWIALFNLLDNAGKYSFRDRYVGIEISARRTFFVIRISNYGVPIAKDRDGGIDHIFEPFVRASMGDGSDKRAGTGLGLTVAKAIARTHHPEGDVTIEVNESSKTETPNVPALTVAKILVPKDPPR